MITIRRQKPITNPYKGTINRVLNNEIFNQTIQLRYAGIFRNSPTCLTNGNPVRIVVTTESPETEELKYRVEIRIKAEKGYAVVGQALVSCSLKTSDTYVQEIIEQKVHFALRKSMNDSYCYEIVNDAYE